MGSCISKCKPRAPKRKSKEEEDEDDRRQDCNHVQDKVVIVSHDDRPPPSKMPKIPPLVTAPAAISPAPSSSFSVSTNTKCAAAAASSSLSSSSSSSSASSVKGQNSFSNDFLWSCVKDNLRVSGLNHAISQLDTLKKPFDTGDHKIHRHNLGYQSPLLASPMPPKPTQPLQGRPMISVAMPKKRARASSPTLIRQKSFRKEQNPTHPTPNRAQWSPSPNRRFNRSNPKTMPTQDSPSRRHLVAKPRAGVNPPTHRKMETFRAPTASPNGDNLIISSQLPGMRTDILQQKISTKVDQDNVGGVGQEMDTVMEDIANPLIALDCFIFL